MKNKIKSEVDYFLDGCDTPQNIHLTTSQRIEIIGTVVARRVSDNIDAKVKEIADKIDRVHGKSNRFVDAFVSGVGQFMAEWKAKK